MDSQEWFEFRQYIESLLLDGKRSQHPDFQVLFNVFGREKVIAIAKEILEREKQCSSEKEINIIPLKPLTGSPQN